MFLERTREGMVAIYSRATGERLYRWPVDARAMIETADYTIERPDETPEDGVPMVPFTPLPQSNNPTIAANGAPIVVQHKDDLTAPAAVSPIPSSAKPAPQKGKR